MIYQSFAKLYDELFDETEYQKWFDYTASQIDLSKRHNWLELACGSGRIAVKLAKSNQVVTGFDLSDEMLALASQHAQENNVDLSLVQGNMLDLSGLDKFEIISCYADSFCYLSDEKEVLKAFKEVFNHLDANGKFIFDVITPYQTGVVYPGYMFNYQDDDETFVWSSFGGDDQYHVEHDLTFFNRTPDDKYVKTTETHFERTYDLKTYVDMLKTAGFSNINYSANYGLNPISKNTTRWFFSCQKESQ